MVTVIYCTRESNPTHTQHIIKTSGLHKNIEVIEIVNNGEALTKSYNRGLQQASNDIVIFMHDDVEIETSSWGNKLVKHFQMNPDFGILGLAGTTDIPLSGKWWEDRSKMVGIVNHKKDGKKWESKYSKSWGNNIKEVISVDGLFFAIHKQRIKENFDENVDGFHFYEIDFMFANHLKGVKIGVMFNIRVTHNSIGITNDQWETNRVNFVNKFNDELPEKLVPDFYLPEEKEVVNKVKVRVVIQSMGDVDSIINLHSKIESFKVSNLTINVISDSVNYERLKELDLNNTKLFQGFYETLPKNLSVLKHDNDFIDKDDELVFFINDNLKIINNIFANFIKLYNTNKNTFGCGFPLSYNENKTVFSTSLDIFTNKENRVAINMRDTNTYYNVHYGQLINPIGNLSDCMVTTASNLKILDWFNVEFETPLYFNEFALRLYLKKKINYNDTNSLTVQGSFKEQSNIQKDFQALINFIGNEPKLQETVKRIE